MGDPHCAGRPHPPRAQFSCTLALARRVKVRPSTARQMKTGAHLARARQVKARPSTACQMKAGAQRTRQVKARPRRRTRTAQRTEPLRQLRHSGRATTRRRTRSWAAAERRRARTARHRPPVRWLIVAVHLPHVGQRRRPSRSSFRAQTRRSVRGRRVWGIVGHLGIQWLAVLLRLVYPTRRPALAPPGDAVNQAVKER